MVGNDTMNKAMNLHADKSQLKPEWLALGVITAAALLTGFLPQTLLSVLVVLACVFLLLIDKLYMAFPFMIFYYQLFGMLFGISVYRIFSLLFLFSAILKLGGEKKLRLSHLLPIPVFLFYCLTVMMDYSTQRAIFAFVDVVFSIIFTCSTVAADAEKAKHFFRVYVLVCFTAFFSGLVGANTMDYTMVGVEMSRFQATFNDPNYMGFFYTSGIFAMVTLKLFSPKLRALLAVLLYAMLLSSLSVTAVIVNIVLWLIYLFACKKLGLKTLLVLLLVIILLLNLYSYGLEHPSTPVIGSISLRIEEKLAQLSGGNLDSATTGRTELSQAHLAYFASLPLLKQFFGGTAVNTYFISPSIYGAAHNEYVDLLLNVGIAGTLLLVLWILSRTVKYFVEYRKTEEPLFACLFMSKLAWIIYALTLTTFLDFRFMFAFFL